MNTSVGGLGPGEGNVFAWNGGGGVSGRPGGVFIGGDTVTLRGNRFYGNGPVGIALEFDPPNPADPGDGDTGANALQNAPVLAGIDYGPPTVAHFVLSSTPSTTFDVDFYANLQCVTRPTAYPEGEDDRRDDPGDDRCVGSRDDRLHASIAARAGPGRDGDRHRSRRQHVRVLADDPAEDRAPLRPGGGRGQRDAFRPALRGRRGRQRRRCRAVERRRLAAVHHHGRHAGVSARDVPRRGRHEPRRTGGNAQERVRGRLPGRAPGESLPRRHRQARGQRGHRRHRRRPLRRQRPGQAPEHGGLPPEGRARPLLHAAALHAAPYLPRRPLPFGLRRLDRGALRARASRQAAKAAISARTGRSSATRWRLSS